ncbi:DUF1616 domain-containing protein [Halorussus salilacus]|uniref:DUF1616 domain-containing protein n=1 Tax=Halorussus salilacus TaxID=2953750 RepID=UPI00209F40E6|nr:DUF1616 domain-containing protein [Halorussus salilacus]USZ67934.1 DUF1616 domain-containing protein [Halorussus salilacus]
MSARALTRRVPFDLVAVACLTALAAALVLNAESSVPLAELADASPGAIAARLTTVALGLAFLLVLPGYAVVSVLFPGHEPAVERLDPEGEPMAPRFQFRARRGIDALERLTLAVGVSAVVTPTVALALNFTPWGIRVEPLVLAVAGVTLVGCLLGSVRRWRLPPGDRFAPTLLPSASPLFSDGPESKGGEAAESSGDAASAADSDGGHPVANAVFAVGVVVALAGIGYAVAAPQPGDQFTELYLLSEDENGTLVADDYPEFADGEPASLAVGVRNHEGQPTTYAMVAQLQDVEETDDGLAVESATEVQRTEVSLDDGERENVSVEFTPDATENVRLHVMLFRGSVPDEPTGASAYRSVTLRLDTIHESEGE